MRLSPYFALAEFTRSATAGRLKLSNQPNLEELRRLGRLAKTLEEIRARLGGLPIIITSGFRAEAVNDAVGGVPNSAHRLGLAADFTIPQYGTVLATCHAIADSGIEFDQLINEHDRWIHLGLAAGTQRRELLTITSDGTYAGLA